MNGIAWGKWTFSNRYEVEERVIGNPLWAQPSFTQRRLRLLPHNDLLVGLLPLSSARRNAVGDCDSNRYIEYETSATYSSTAAVRIHQMRYAKLLNYLHLRENSPI